MYLRKYGNYISTIYLYTYILTYIHILNRYNQQLLLNATINIRYKLLGAYNEE